MDDPYVKEELIKKNIQGYDFEFRKLLGEDYIELIERGGELDKNNSVQLTSKKATPIAVVLSITKYPFKTKLGFDWGEATFEDKLESIRKLKVEILIELINTVAPMLDFDERVKKKLKVSSGLEERKMRKSLKKSGV